MDNGFARSGLHDCPAQLPNRHQRHRSHLAGGRIRSHHSDGLDGDLWRCLRDANSYAHSYGDRDNDINTNSYADCFAVIDAYTDSNTFGYAYSNSDWHT
jgi:hypothetical protein